ncbi:MAG TPA: protoheme IX farnesyltransferase [Bacteroidales bacterium]|nr:protoheme IX farnesyltransferase [Bacteroidales bacterium]
MVSDPVRSVLCYLEMFKLKIMVPVSLTGFTGFFLYNPSFSSAILLVTTGILCLSVSASILNQIQEVDTDKLMERTKNRPLPSGKLRKQDAYAAFLVFLIAGSFLVFSGGNIVALLLSLFTVLWYNGVYTLLKRVTAYAVIPGALTGALPPFIGWVAAGGNPFDARVATLMLMFFAGQMPHFWLLLLKYGDQYAAAGMPSLTSTLNEKFLKKLILSFIILTSVAALLLKTTGVIANNVIFVSTAVISGILVVLFYIFLEDKNAKREVSRYSIFLNTYYLIVMVLLVSDRLIQQS